jgi:hypothetical protein
MSFGLGRVRRATIRLSGTIPSWCVLGAVHDGGAEDFAGFVAQAVGEIACGLSGEMAS